MCIRDRLSTCWSQSSALQLKVHIGGLEDDNAVQYLYYEDDTWWACPVSVGLEGAQWEAEHGSRQLCHPSTMLLFHPATMLL